MTIHHCTPLEDENRRPAIEVELDDQDAQELTPVKATLYLITEEQGIITFARLAQASIFNADIALILAQSLAPHHGVEHIYIHYREYHSFTQRALLQLQ